MLKASKQAQKWRGFELERHEPKKLSKSNKSSSSSSRRSTTSSSLQKGAKVSIYDTDSSSFSDSSSDELTKIKEKDTPAESEDNMASEIKRLREGMESLTILMTKQQKAFTRSPGAPMANNPKRD
ncbi:hypothetical protein BGZ76_007987, partial [Entomortierella beljakovae]